MPFSLSLSHEKKNSTSTSDSDFCSLFSRQTTNENNVHTGRPARHQRARRAQQRPMSWEMWVVIVDFAREAGRKTEDEKKNQVSTKNLDQNKTTKTKTNRGARLLSDRQGRGRLLAGSVAHEEAGGWVPPRGDVSSRWEKEKFFLLSGFFNQNRKRPAKRLFWPFLPFCSFALSTPSRFRSPARRSQHHRHPCQARFRLIGYLKKVHSFGCQF